MKILKRGKIRWDRKHIVKCYNCGCLFICKDSETEFAFQNNNKYWEQRVKCPCCNQTNMLK